MGPDRGVGPTAAAYALRMCSTGWNQRSVRMPRGMYVDFEDIDLLDRDRFTQGIPHEWFTWLRANAPVYHHPEPGGPGFWVITRYDDIVACNRDAQSFSSAQRLGGVVGLEGPTESPPGMEAGGTSIARLVLPHADGKAPAM